MNHSGWFEEREAPLRKGEEEETFFFGAATNELNFASGVCFWAARFAPFNCFRVFRKSPYVQACLALIEKTCGGK